jgi:phosphoribosylpyrophosphate synthetase
MRLRNVADKTVIIYDDMIRSGGSIINAAKKLPAPIRM